MEYQICAAFDTSPNLDLAKMATPSPDGAGIDLGHGNRQAAHFFRQLADRIERGDISNWSLDRRIFEDDVTSEGATTRQFNVSPHAVVIFSYTASVK
jgi:hypothetical protein